MTYAHINVRPVTGGIGAEISGIDLSRPISDNVFGEVRSAFADHGVIFFRDQRLTPEQHVALAEKFGPININRFFKAVDGYPMIAEVRKEPEQKKNIGGGWHTDHSYDQAPAMGSLLYAREVPPSGGDTLFASMASVYESLSDGLKKTLASLKAVHSSRHIFGAQGRSADMEGGRIGNSEAATQDAIHPLVVTHPLSGRKGLYVCPSFTTHIEGWTVEESRPLLSYLTEQIRKPEHGCRFQWTEGALAIWDNRACWHYAVNDYHGARRLMHRITVEGVELH
jgi:taurine dioxygenase